MMKCSLAGSIGLLLLCAAIGLNTVALILPMWSATEFNESSSSSAVKEADLAAGVWGFCTDAQVRISHTSRAANGTLAFDQCFFFHTATHFEVPKFGTAESFNFNDASICSGFASAVDTSNATERHAFVSTYAELAAQSTASFDKFLSRSCGALGYSVLLFAFAAPALGVLASLALIADMTCAGQRTISITAAKYLSVAAFVSGAIAIGLWIPQQYPIENASFGGGFVVAGISAVFYLNVLVLCARHEHVTKPRKEEPGAEIADGAADRQRVISEQV